uniref:Si:dkey-61f9.1 n=2 Tax=Gasterosteus aculeatus aculeatus TaxID=481459 RepID=G3Q4T8_GASAC|nr:C-type mannose receptor 2 isoform X2 [Gasterosteus aculeatus aculeatus]
MALVLLLLFSGLSYFTLASNRLRYFNDTGVQHGFWNESCNGASHVTVYDEEDFEFVKSFLAFRDSSHVATWLGLHKTKKNISWSNDTPFNSTMFTENGTQSQICVAINGTTWNHFNCAERKPFMCHIGSNYKLITRNKNWCQALQYCRTHNGDLVSIGNDTENKRAIEKGEGKSFWIGLLNDDWEWEDGSCSTFREWNTSRVSPGSTFAYTTFSNISKEIIKVTDDGHADSFCTKGTTRIKVIPYNLTWEEAFNYCKESHTGLLQIIDENDQKAVEQWLNYTSVSGPFWIGLRQSRVFGFWIWSDRMVNFSKWKNGIQPELPLSNLCGAINSNYMWTDENCLVRQPFLCEEEIVFMNKLKTARKQ